MPQASAGQIFSRTLQLAGITGLTFHDTRHEALTRLARKLDVLDLAHMVGHRDPRSLMVYYNATAEEIARRLDRYETHPTRRTSPPNGFLGI